MLIDWFTVGAQALNFLILVWLMKRFLYKPVLNAIDAREKKVASELADADRKKKEAQTESAEFKRRSEEFDGQRSALLSKATEEAQAERGRLLEEARAAADALGAKRREGLKREEQALRGTILGQLRTEVLSVARKALTDLADAGLEERAAATFVRRLREMKDPAKAAFGEALGKSADPAVLRTAFGLTTEQRASLQTALNQFFSADVRLRFEVAPDLIGGIDLTVQGLKVAWNVDDYLTSLGIEVGRAIEAETKAEPAANPARDPAVPAGKT